MLLLLLLLLREYYYRHYEYYYDYYVVYTYVGRKHATYSNYWQYSILSIFPRWLPQAFLQRMKEFFKPTPQTSFSPTTGPCVLRPLPIRALLLLLCILRGEGLVCGVSASSGLIYSRRGVSNDPHKLSLFLSCFATLGSSLPHSIKIFLLAHFITSCLYLMPYLLLLVHHHHSNPYL